MIYERFTLLIALALMNVIAFDTKAQTASELCIQNGERNIFGVISRPQNAEEIGVAIVSHGFNGTHNFAADYYETLNSMGYAVYSFDFPCGSVHSKSDNNTMNMSILDETEDLKAVVKYFKGSSGSKGSKSVVLIGESQGGLVSALAAADMGKDTIDKLILIYPALCIPDNWTSNYPNIEDIPDTTRVWGVPLGRRFFLEIRDKDPFSMISKYEGPVQIIHGDKDPVVPVSYSQKAVEVYKDARLHVIPGAGHGFRPEERTVSNRVVHDFLTK